MIKTLGDLAATVEGLKKQGKTLVQCHGVFDLLHPGHIRHFEAAKAQGDVLVVTVTPDRFVNKGPHRPVFPEMLRAEAINALGCVDYVAINEFPAAVEAIKRLKPDVYAKGGDYAKAEDDVTGGIVKEEEAVRSVGGRIHFTNELSFSSTELLNANFGVYPEEAREFLEGFRGRHTAQNIINRLKDLKKLKVMLVGDTIIDQYCYVEALGKSPKDNIITTRYLREESFAGGVLAAANHLAGFCDDVHLVTCLGEYGRYRRFITKRLKPNITPHFFYRDNAPTVVKRRFVDPAFLYKMFEVARLDDTGLPPELNDEVCAYLEEKAGDYDLVLVTDFGHGFIDREMAKLLWHKAKFLAVNAQTNSANMGFNLITKYLRANYVCLDELEVRLVCQDKFGNIKHMIREIANLVGAKQMAVTRGHRGSMTYEPTSGFVEVPVFSKQIVDRTGAGDAYLSITALCAAADFPPEVLGFIGNAVGALAVRIVGNRESVESAHLFKFIGALLK